jgi:hypothetical protein
MDNDFGSPAVANCGTWAAAEGFTANVSAGAYALVGSASALAIVGGDTIGANAMAYMYGYYCEYSEWVDVNGNSGGSAYGSLCEFGLLYAHS